MSTEPRRVVICDESLIHELQDLASWEVAALAAWLQYDQRRVERDPGENDGTYHERCMEAWTASGRRAEAEESAAAQAAVVAKAVLEALRAPTTVTDRSPAFSVDHAKLQQWWTDLVDEGTQLVGEIYDNAALAVEDFVHDGPWLQSRTSSLRLQAHMTCEDGIVDGFVLAIYDRTWRQGPFGLCIATGHIATNEIDRQVDPVEFACSIIDIANSLLAAVTTETLAEVRS